MEIYHRDHWIIIVHMAIWKDLTKWNEEDTIIDCINHMGRIVKRVFPVLMRMRMHMHMRMCKNIWYIMYYFIS